ncbi:ATP-grasp domain-containing protein [uncultured Algibacter sp.]|uniref:ATP-grasp domain-containing protein n=1 Tax=uncultured Algibacter sp. TaxID=298659 RepID=UPI00263076BC|nr:ATP-grasp domain-containing protein [uncultured Algibacter sp.]
MTIIFTCSGRRNYLIRYFKSIIGSNVTTIAIDSQKSATALQDADIAIIVPEISSDEYIIELKKIVVEYKADAIIPLNDLEFPLLLEHKKSLEALGATVFISNEKITNIALDKWKSYNFFKSQGFNTPKTFLKIENAISAIETNEISFPLIIKPRWGSASIEIHLVNSIEELNLAFKLQKFKQNSLVFEMLNKENSEDFIIIQEFIKGDEYGMDILNDLNGNFVDVFVRKKLAMRSGETDKALTIIDENLKNVGKKLAEATNHLGVIDCDFFVAKDKVYLLEINPRFGGGYPFTHEAGANIPAIYISWLTGNNNIKEYLNYNSGLSFAKYSRIMMLK